MIPTLEDRYEYLALSADVADITFGFDRWVNQNFYRSAEWKNARRHVIIRDDGWDLGVYDVPISGRVIIHHMNPLTLSDIEEGSDNLLNPEFLICCSHRTHNAIHYGDRSQLPQPYIPRQPGDTRSW
jgi:hypothetical protein